MSFTKRPKEPVASGVIVSLAGVEPLPALAKEAAAILRALEASVETQAAPAASADFLAVLLVDGAEARLPPLPDLKDRAATAIAVGEDAAACRASLAAVRKRLRAAGAVLGPHELVLAPSDFGFLGLESDGRRERLEILLGTLVSDAERLRLRREGWEEPEG